MKMITQSELMQLFSYDPSTGDFTRLSRIRRHQAGETAGWTDDRGYRRIKIDGRNHFAHRLAWLYVHGTLPTQIDHINQDTGDNRIANLRDATHALNQRNKRNSSLYRPPSTMRPWSFEEEAILAPLIILAKARFVEAADTFAHLGPEYTGPSLMRSVWPTYASTTLGGHDVGYGGNGQRVIYRPNSAAVSRAEEVVSQWVPTIRQQDDRVLAGAWAQCLAAPRIAGSWRSYCREKRLNRTTADRHVFSAFHSVAVGLSKNSQMLHEPDWVRLVPRFPISGTDIDMVAERVTERANHWRADDAKPTSQPDMRDTSWAEGQNEMRRRRVANG
ncbi:MULTISPECIES: HNH endonuclease signature motif containing protein [unclassified Aureimonas]|uniref:HNH endonuclease signature motif containing protein n=1 Tax=unclassified Aureimonas TaxID=2615206 RepID=UPI0009EB1448|nr:MULTISPECIES: HNH endonuclease signature motif containing protein [unclassified Aureimonas]